MTIISSHYKMSHVVETGNKLSHQLNRFCSSSPFKATSIITFLYTASYTSLHISRQKPISEKTKKALQAISLLSSFGGSFLLKLMIKKWKHLPLYILFNLPLSKIHLSLVQYGMKNSLYVERSFFNKDKLIAELKFLPHPRNHKVPELHLHTENPLEMGFAQGFLLGDKIEDLYHRIFKPMVFLLGVLTGDYSGSKFAKRITQLHFSKKHLTELDGVIRGIETYASRKGYETKLTLENLKQVHALSDTYKALGMRQVGGIYPSTLGCSSAVVKFGHQMTLLRTLDWPGFVDMGRHIFIKQYTKNQKTLRVQTFPGYCGVLTGSNDRGLKLVINELGSYVGTGTPYSLLAREVLERASSVEEAKKIIESPTYKPASSHHILLMDQKKGCNIQFVDGVVRIPRMLVDNGHLIVTNHGVDQNEGVISGSEADITSFKRYQTMKSLIMSWESMAEKSPLPELAKRVLQSVNGYNTTAAVIYHAGGVESHVFDSHYAGKHIYHDLNKK
jgi:predicted choloylglycine hydrolase